ncbi:MAG: porphobilinogen synthase [Deltaproteobacteria bacterium]|nr:porphobilinogen synthase [Deltaproteobacteria bacterium]
MTSFPIQRPRRLRQNSVLRSMVSETRLSLPDLILPLFVTHGKKIHNPISSMPGVFQLSVDLLEKEAREIRDLKIPAVILFGIPETKDSIGSSGYAANGVIPQAIQALKNTHPDLLVITDVCLCEYTDHGHCGVMQAETHSNSVRVDNDATLDLLSKMAAVHAKAGADMVAPSDMMDGRIQKIRDELDAIGHKEMPIMSYAVKYASSFYAPFREAAGSKPMKGDRKTYQMDPANIREALREARLDIEEGADILMVKPALAYLDVIKTLRDEYSTSIAAYQVSGEYAMIKAAANQGFIDEKAVVLESLTSIKRAGADLILTYFAKDVAKWLREEQL